MVSLRSGRHFLWRRSSARLTHGFAEYQPDLPWSGARADILTFSQNVPSRHSPLAILPSRHRFAPLPAPLTDQPLLPVVALATMLLAPVPAFARFDATFSGRDVQDIPERDLRTRRTRWNAGLSYHATGRAKQRRALDMPDPLASG
jgi:hypothetical protein